MKIQICRIKKGVASEGAWLAINPLKPSRMSNSSTKNKPQTAASIAACLWYLWLNCCPIRGFISCFPSRSLLLLSFRALLLVACLCPCHAVSFLEDKINQVLNPDLLIYNLTESSFHLCQNLLVGNSLALLIFSDHLKEKRKFGKQM